MIDENLYTSHFIFIKLVGTVGTFTLVYIVLLCKKDYVLLISARDIRAECTVAHKSGIA